MAREKYFRTEKKKLSPRKRMQFPGSSSFQDQSTHRDDAQYEGRILEIILETEMNLADVLGGFRAVNVHIHQRYGPALEERHLEQTPKDTHTVRN